MECRNSMNWNTRRPREGWAYMPDRTYSDQGAGIQALADKRPREEWLRLAAVWDGCEVQGPEYQRRAARCRHYADITQRITASTPRPVRDAYGFDVTHNRRPHRERRSGPAVVKGQLPLM